NGVDVETYEVKQDMINNAISEANKFIAPISMKDSALAFYGIEYQYSTVVFLTRTSLRHYYKVTDISLYEAAKANGDITGANERHLTEYSYIYFEFADIPAPELADLKALTIGGKTYYSSALTYSRAVLASSAATSNEKALAMASYRYYMKAKAYFG
ncbi:MAG: hypothetical protein IJS94_03810, partial [Clostridia bacterium]|nr:hypothetical protein [Clostridia bacterium]